MRNFGWSPAEGIPQATVTRRAAAETEAVVGFINSTMLTQPPKNPEYIDGYGEIPGPAAAGRGAAFGIHMVLDFLLGGQLVSQELSSVIRILSNFLVKISRGVAPNLCDRSPRCNFNHA